MNTPTPNPLALEILESLGDDYRVDMSASETWLTNKLADMTARAEQLESERENWRVSSVAREAVARAEAAEAACKIKDEALASVNKFIREEVYREYGGQDEPCQPADQLSYDAVAYIREIEAALSKSPAETRSVIAGLRFSLELHHKLLVKVGVTSTDADEMVKQANEIAGLREEVTRLVSEKREQQEIFSQERSELYSAESNLRKERDEFRNSLIARDNVGMTRAEYHEAKRALAQRDALIAAGNDMQKEIKCRRRGQIPSKDSLPAWQAAVSGAQAGAKGEDDLAELLEDKARLDWLEVQLIHMYDAGGCYCLEYGPISEPKKVGDEEEMGVRQAIDAARKTHL